MILHVVEFLFHMAFREQKDGRKSQIPPSTWQLDGFLRMSFAMDGPSVLQQLRPKLLLQLKPRAHGLEALHGPKTPSFYGQFFFGWLKDGKPQKHTLSG